MANQVVYTKEGQFVGYFDDAETDLQKFLQSLDPDSTFVPPIDVCVVEEVKDDPREYAYDKDAKKLDKIRPQFTDTDFPKDIEFSTKLLLLYLYGNELDAEKQRKLKTYFRELLKRLGGINQVYSDIVESIPDDAK